jgi:hypothetical protein
MLDRLEAMERGIFTHPPSDWEEFQKRLGRWAELKELVLILEGKQQEQDNG